MKRLLFVIFLIKFVPGIFYGQSTLSTAYPYLYDVRLQCTVKQSMFNNCFYYDFRLISSSENRGDIFIIEIDASRTSQSVVYDTLGLNFRSNFISLLFHKHFPRLSNFMIPVSVSKLPNFNWDASPSDNFTISIGVDTLLPKPGDTVDNIQMMSKALPGIRKFTVKPYFNVSEFFPSMDDSLDLLSIDQMDSIRTSTYYQGYTVGPFAPQLIFNGVVFIDNITSYTTQSRTLGWIKNQGTANKYLAFLSMAKTGVQQNDTGSALSLLRQILHDVDIDSTANLTSEAYALLRYNTEYLIDQIKGIQHLTRQMTQGWNMVSVPFVQTDYRSSVVFPGNFGDMFKYNTVTREYETAGTLSCGPGYWAYYLAPQANTISGTIPSTLSVHTDQAGWVLLGSSNTTVQLSALQLNNGSQIFGGEGYRFDGQAYQLTSEIAPGESIWVYVLNPCTITFP